MNLRRIMLPAVLVLSVGLAAACGDDDDDITVDDVRGEARTQYEVLAQDIRTLADDIDRSLDGADFAALPQDTRSRWDSQCQELISSTTDQTILTRLTEACTDLREGLNLEDEGQVNDAKDDLNDLADDIDDALDDADDDLDDDNATPGLDSTPTP